MGNPNSIPRALLLARLLCAIRGKGRYITVHWLTGVR